VWLVDTLQFAAAYAYPPLPDTLNNDVYDAPITFHHADGPRFRPRSTTRLPPLVGSDDNDARDDDSSPVAVSTTHTLSIDGRWYDVVTLDPDDTLDWLPTLTTHSSDPPTPSTLSHTISSCARITSHLAALYHPDCDTPDEPYPAHTPANATSHPYHLDTDPDGPRFHPTIDTFCDPDVFISVPPPDTRLTLTIDGLAYRVPGDDHSLH
jgi:hypothetical protein